MAEHRVSGWVRPENVMTLMEKLARYVGYDFSESDQLAVANAAGDRLEYPIVGEPRLDVTLARDLEGGVPITVTVVGPMSDELALRIDILIDLLGELRPGSGAEPW